MVSAVASLTHILPQAQRQKERVDSIFGYITFLGTIALMGFIIQSKRLNVSTFNFQLLLDFVLGFVLFSFCPFPLVLGLAFLVGCVCVCLDVSTTCRRLWGLLGLSLVVGLVLLLVLVFGSWWVGFVFLCQSCVVLSSLLFSCVCVGFWGLVLSCRNEM